MNRRTLNRACSLKFFMRLALTGVALCWGSAVLAAAGDYITTWGTSGKTLLPNTTSLVADFEAPRQALGTADGGMVMIGWGQTGFNADGYLAKHTATGAVDATFGKRIVRFAANVDDFLIGGALQADGKIIAVGHTSEGSNVIAVVLRFNADGSPDPGFGNQGWTAIPRFGDHATMEAYGVTVDSLGRIVVVGNARDTSAAAASAFMSRLTSAGAMDLSFGSNGSVALQAPEGAGVAASTSLYRVIQQPVSGDYVAVGSAFLGVSKNSNIVAATRVTAAGVPDTTFGTSGWTLRDLSDRAGCPALASLDNCASGGFGLAAYIDGRIAVVGYAKTTFAAGSAFNTTATAINTDAAVVDWLNSDGTPDSTRLTQRFALKFNDLGTSAARDASIDASGNLFVAAQTFGVLQNSHVGVAKFNNAGALASGFQGTTSGSSGIILAGIASAGLSSGDVRGISLNAATGSVKVGGRGRATFANDGRPRRFATVQFTSTGALDAGYDGDGIATSLAPKQDVQGRLLVPNPDGSVMVVSNTHDASDPTAPGTGSARALDSKILLNRLTAAGALDASFGVAGSFVVPRLNEVSTVVAGTMLGFFPRAALRITLPVDPAALPRNADDGKYLVAGQCSIYRSTTATDTDACVVRLLASGSIDTTFGGSGFFLSGSAGFADIAYGMRLHGNADANEGKIVLAVQAAAAGVTNASVVRLNANGSLDTSFGGTGSMTIALPAAVTQSRTFGLRIDSSGRYLIAGHLQPFAFSWSPFVARVTTGGTMDTSFASGGIRYGIPASYLPHGDAFALGLAVYNSGRIVVSGYFDMDVEDARKTRSYVMALTSDGLIDPSFADDGLKILDNDADTFSSEGWLVSIEAGGRLLVGSTRTVNNASRSSEMRLTRLNYDGTYDSSFNAVGYKTLAFPASTSVPAQPQVDFLRAFNADAAGNFYVGGSTWNDASDGRVPAVAKLEAEAISLDATYRNFYAVRSGQPFAIYQAQYVYAVSNRSPGPITLNIALSGSNTSKFTLDNVLCASPGVADPSNCSTAPGAGNNVIPTGFETPCGASLPAAGKCNLLVSFRPGLADAGYFEATLNVGDLKAVLAGHTCQLELDRDSARLIEPAVEGLLYLRYLLGFRGASLIANIAFTGTALTATQVENRIGRQFVELDVDGDNSTLALRDGIMLLRTMLGLKAGAVTAGAVNPTGSRNNWDAIQNHLRYTCGAAYSLD